MLLGAVVEVALEALPFPIPALDDSCARTPEILEFRQDLRLQPFVLDGEACRRSQLALQDGPVDDPSVVRDNRKPPASTPDRGRCTPRLGHGLRKTVPVGPDETP